MSDKDTPTTDAFAVPAASASAPDDTLEDDTPAQVYLGCVKWFDDQKGYGFIKVLEPALADVFVHIRDLNPKFTHNPTLYTGEYVEFSTAPNGHTPEGVVRLKATNVTGPRDGTLLCDHGQINFRSYSRVGFNNNNNAATDGN